MTTVLVILLIVAFVLASEALRERRNDRHGLERRVVTYAGTHDPRVAARLDSMRTRAGAGILDRHVASRQRVAVGR